MPQSDITPERLIDATEYLLRIKQTTAWTTAWPNDHRPLADKVKAFSLNRYVDKLGYTQEELLEAASFLCRLGFGDGIH